MASVLSDAEVNQSFDSGTTEYEIEASIIEELRREASHITCDWAASAHTRASAFNSIVKPLHLHAYELLAAISSQPLNLAIRNRLTKVDFRLVNIYRPGMFTPQSYEKLPLGLKVLFQQLRRILVESSYFEWCISVRDEFEQMHFSKKLRNVIEDKDALIEEHLQLLDKRDHNGVLDKSNDARILEIQDHIFAGDYFTDRDREEHTVQMEMIEARQKIDKEIRDYVKTLASHHRYEEAQWAGEFFAQVEKQRVALEVVAAQEKQAKEFEDKRRHDALEKYIWEQFERRKKDRMSNAKLGDANTSAENTSKASTALVKVRDEKFNWAEEMNRHVAATAENFSPKPAKVLPAGFNLATGHIALPADYRPPIWATMKVVDNPEMFNRQIFDIESAAFLESKGIRPIEKEETNQIYDQLVFEGKAAEHVLELVSKRRQREADAAAQRKVENLKKLETEEAQYVAKKAGQETEQEAARKTAFHVQQANASQFKRFIQEQISESTIEHYYRHFLSKAYTRINPTTGQPMVNREQYGDQYREQLSQMAQHALRQGEALKTEDERQLMYKDYCAPETIKKIWRMTAQTLNAYEKRNAKSGVSEQKREAPGINGSAKAQAMAMAMQVSTVATANSSTGLDYSMADRKFPVSTIPPDDIIHNQPENLTRRPSAQLEDSVMPNQADKLRLLQALQDKATLRSVSGQSASLEAAKSQKKRSVPTRDGDKVWLGNIFGWRSVHDPPPSGMTLPEYNHWAKIHEKSKKLNANVDTSASSVMSAQGPRSFADADDGQNAVTATAVASATRHHGVLGGMTVDTGMQVAMLRTVDNGILRNPGQNARLAHGQARMPIGKILQQHHRRPVHQHRGLSIGSHIAHAGFGSTRSSTPSKLGQYAHTAERAEAHSGKPSVEMKASSELETPEQNEANRHDPSDRTLALPDSAFAAAALAIPISSPAIDSSPRSPPAHAALFEWRKPKKPKVPKIKSKSANTTSTEAALPATQSASVPFNNEAENAQKYDNKATSSLPGGTGATAAVSDSIISPAVRSPSSLGSSGAALRESRMLGTLSGSQKESDRRKNVDSPEKSAELAIRNNGTSSASPDKSAKTPQQTVDSRQKSATETQSCDQNAAFIAAAAPLPGYHVAAEPSFKPSSTPPRSKAKNQPPKTPKIKLPSTTTSLRPQKGSAEDEALCTKTVRAFGDDSIIFGENAAIPAKSPKRVAQPPSFRASSQMKFPTPAPDNTAGQPPKAPVSLCSETYKTSFKATVLASRAASISSGNVNVRMKRPGLGPKTLSFQPISQANQAKSSAPTTTPLQIPKRPSSQRIASGNMKAFTNAVALTPLQQLNIPSIQHMSTGNGKAHFGAVPCTSPEPQTMPTNQRMGSSNAKTSSNVFSPSPRSHLKSMVDQLSLTSFSSPTPVLLSKIETSKTSGGLPGFVASKWPSPPHVSFPKTPNTAPRKLFAIDVSKPDVFGQAEERKELWSQTSPVFQHEPPSGPRHLSAVQFNFPSNSTTAGYANKPSSTQSSDKEKLIELLKTPAYQLPTAASKAKSSGDNGSASRNSHQKRATIISEPSAFTPTRKSSGFNISRQEQKERAWRELMKKDMLAKQKEQEGRLRAKHETFAPAIKNPDVPVLDFAEQAKFMMDSLNVSAKKTPRKGKVRQSASGRRCPGEPSVPDSNVAKWKTPGGQAVIGSLDALADAQSRETTVTGALGARCKNRVKLQLGPVAKSIMNRPFQFLIEPRQKHFLPTDAGFDHEAESPMKKTNTGSAMPPTSAPAIAETSAAPTKKKTALSPVSDLINELAAELAAKKARAARFAVPSTHAHASASSVQLPAPAPAPIGALPAQPKSVIQQNSEAIQKRLQELEAQARQRSPKSAGRELQTTEFLAPGETFISGQRKAAMNGVPKFMTKGEWEAVAEKARLREELPKT